MTKTKTTSCGAHCWHVTSSTTDGMGQKGWHDETCCWCGERRRNHWVIARDHNHGRFVPQHSQILDVKHEYYPSGRRSAGDS